MKTRKASNDNPVTDTPPPASSSLVKRFLPVFVILAALVAFIALGGPKYINLQSLQDNQETLKAFVMDHKIGALIGFMLLYATLVAISVPGASFLSIFAGFLFGVVPGTIAVVLGATFGAALLFLAARSALGAGLAQKAGPFMQKFEKGLKKNELSYMFILRLVPLFPFFIVNIVPALFDVKLRNYVISTFIGIIPGSLVYVSVGNGIGDVVDAGQNVPLSGLMFRPAVILPILGLIILSLIPVAYQHMKIKKANTNS
jgi:uncharacterized membrane protein YdjX (TVP38/TMEM64 family)